jgi:hypothetical protein
MKLTLSELFFRIFIAICTGVAGITILWILLANEPLRTKMPEAELCYACSLALGILLAFRLISHEDAPTSSTPAAG